MNSIHTSLRSGIISTLPGVPEPEIGEIPGRKSASAFFKSVLR